MGLQFSTSDVGPKDRLLYWRDAICNAFVQLECRAPRCRPFRATLRSRSIGPLGVSVVTSTTQHVMRTRRQIVHANEEAFLLSFQIAGTALVRQDQHEAVLRPGSLALYDSTRPYDLIFPGDKRQLVLQVPRKVLKRFVPHADRLTARVLDPLRFEVQVFAGALRSLESLTADTAPSAEDQLAEGIVMLLASALGVAPNPDEHAGSRRVYVARAHAVIMQRANDPDLTPPVIAQSLAISLSHLHRIFAEEPLSLERAIWHERLSRAASDLRDPSLMEHTIDGIAISHGFASAAHFSRAFRRRYGATPSDFRRGDARPG